MRRLLLGLCLLVSALLLDGCQTGDSLDATMRDFMDTIIDQNTGHFMSFVPRHGTWHLVSYDGSIGGIASNSFFTYSETETKLSERSGLWVALFEGSDQYRYKDRIAAHPLSKWVRTDHTYRIPAEEGVSYVTWRLEDGRWVISAIGDTTP